MGIRYLNSYIKRKCPTAIQEVTLTDMKDKKIAIDISIYMYKFASESYLIEGIYQMAITLRKHGIVPVFVFDGRPPPEKMPLLSKRREERKKAELELIAVANEEVSESGSNTEIVAKKRKCVRLRKNDIHNVKNILTLCGISWYQAKGEADELCAKLAIKNRVWACMSEDMDLFVYGCPRVLRYFNLFYGTCMLYDTFAILKSLNLSLREFREICVVSGTDYNIDNTNQFNLYKSIECFSTYKNQISNTRTNFYDWLEIHDNLRNDACELYLAELIFDTSNVSLYEYDINPICNKNIEREKLYEFLGNHNFVFV